MTATYDCIATNLLTTSASTITFGSIPGTYTDLRIVATGFYTSTNTAPNVQFNGDTGSNYGQNAVVGDGSVASGTDYSSSTYIFMSPWGASNWTGGDQQNMVTMDIFSYADTSKFKTVITSAAGRAASTGGVAFCSGIWVSTAAITSITLTGASSFAAGTRATLYGIKAE
jgi:hypothetical protein